MIKISACSNFGRRRFGGGSAVIDEKRIQADNLAFTECVHKISAFYVDYKCPKSLFCVGSKLCAHGVRGLEAMRIPKRQICVGSKGCAHVVCAHRSYAHTETRYVCRSLLTGTPRASAIRVSALAIPNWTECPMYNIGNSL